MGPLTQDDSDTRELVAEVLDEARMRGALNVIVKYLRRKGVEDVRVDFGSVLKRDLQGKPQIKSQCVKLVDLKALIERGLEEGTIEWNGSSDCVFSPIGLTLTFMLCNECGLALYVD
jgi:hypothetical protein